MMLIITLGFFSIPKQTMACSDHPTSSENTQNSCPKEKSHINKEHECCKTHSCKKEKGHCTGQCSNKGCTSSTNHFAVGEVILADLESKNFFAKISNTKFNFKESYYTSAYFSIWLPPKID